MIQVIYGGKGSGKTKRILELANETAQNANGSIVFIDNNSAYIHDLSRDIRFIDTEEYGIKSPKVFTGFVFGLAASDFDLEYIFVDGFLKIVKHSIFELEDMFETLCAFTNARNINMIISVSGEDNDAPEYLKKYMI